MDISSEQEAILREFAQVPFSEAPPIAEYAPYPANCLRIDEGQAVASIGDLVTDEETHPFEPLKARGMGAAVCRHCSASKRQHK
jgi:hypothetical protein